MNDEETPNPAVAGDCGAPPGAWLSAFMLATVAHIAHQGKCHRCRKSEMQCADHYGAPRRNPNIRETRDAPKAEWKKRYDRHNAHTPVLFPGCAASKFFGAEFCDGCESPKAINTKKKDGKQPRGKRGHGELAA